MVDPAEQLRARGMRVTAPRLAVLRAVTSCPHSTAEAVLADVRACIGTVSRQAVYDTLARLTEGGLIRRIQPGGQPAIYDPRVGDNHHHVVCRACGAASDVDCVVGRVPCLDAPDTDYRVEEAEIIHWGTCPDCLRGAGGGGGTSRPRRSRAQTGPTSSIAGDES
ncbi:MAG: Fur family transcriptional regulator [Planctomycetota bacterium]